MLSWGGVVVREKFAVKLTSEQREQLEKMVRAGKGSARVINRTRVLLKTGEGWSAPQVAQALDVSEGTVFRLKRRFAEAGLEGALKDRVQANRYRKLDDLGRPISSPWPAVQRLKATSTGICACWRTGWWSWEWWSPFPTRRCACI